MQFDYQAYAHFDANDPLEITPEPFVRIPVGVGETVTLVDRDALPLMSQFAWRVSYCGKGKTYIRAGWCRATRRDVTVYLHRIVCAQAHGPAPSARHVADHINGDSLDNRAENLRWLPSFDNRWKHARHKS